jgi:amino acid transporter
MTRGSLVFLSTLALLHIGLALVVAARDPVAVLFATRGLADPLGTAAMASLVVVRLTLVFAGPGVLVASLGSDTPRAGGARGAGIPSDS